MVVLSECMFNEPARQVFTQRGSKVDIPFKVLLLDEANWLRRRAIRLALSGAFEAVMAVVVLVTCAAMVMDTPLTPQSSPTARALSALEFATTAAFALELLVKCLAFGWRNYWARGSNKIDCLVVAVGLLDVALELAGIHTSNALQLLKGLKPVRIVTRFAGMKKMVASIGESMVKMASVTIILALFILIFAILGVQMFSGLFYSCNDAAVAGVAQCIGEYTDEAGATQPRVWSNAFQNFDNIARAFLSLFTIMTLDNAASIMYTAIRAPSEKGLQPRGDANLFAGLYFVIFITIVVFVLLNLYVGVLFLQFRLIKLHTEESSKLGANELQWMSIVKYVMRLTYERQIPPPAARWRRALHGVASSATFEQVIMLVIFLNTAEMTAWWYGQAGVVLKVKENLNLAFSAIFLGECVLKICAYGWPEYWAVHWHKFDFLVVVASIVDIAVSYSSASMGNFVAVIKIQKVLRLTRLSRVLKVLKGLRSIKKLIGTLLRSVASLAQVGSLLFLCFFVFAYAGVQLFARVQRGDTVTEHTNFEDFPHALKVLLRVATNDNWSVLVNGLAAPPDCSDKDGTCGPGFFVTSLYFVAFVSFVSIVMLNLFTTVILDSFEALQEDEEWKINPAEVDVFLQLWGRACSRDGTVAKRDLVNIVRGMAPPLGTGPVSRKQAKRYVDDLMLKQVGHSRRIAFEHALFAIVSRIAEVPLHNVAVVRDLQIALRTYFLGVEMRFDGDVDGAIQNPKLQAVLSWLPGPACVKRFLLRRLPLARLSLLKSTFARRSVRRKPHPGPGKRRLPDAVRELGWLPASNDEAAASPPAGHTP